jgi:hypothetical protein
MKKIFTTFFVFSIALAMQASFHLTLEKWIEEDLVTTDITKDTTIVVTEYEYDEDLEEALMEVRGQLYSDESQNITVTITRKNTGIIDQFCAAGNCVPGNGELTQVCEFTVGTADFQRSWFTHYTPIEPSTEVIVYTFNDGVNPTIKLTVRYSYEDDETAVEEVIARPNDNIIYNLLGQRMPTTNWEEVSAGIYIINGKKYIKK